jgi:nucleoside-diphosphate-sugar epimerase
MKRFIFSSSCSTYGAEGDDFLREDSQLNPVTPYGISKVMVERDVSRVASDNFSPTFLHNATAYGVPSQLRFDLVLNNLVAWAYTTGRVYLKSAELRGGRSFISRISHAAFLAVLHAPREKIHNRAFNVGVSGENFRIRELAEIVREVVPGSHIEFAEGASPDMRNYRVDCSLLPQVSTEYRPHWNARAGAEQLYQTYRGTNLSLEDFEGSRYNRIAHVKQLIADHLLDTTFRSAA